LRAGELNPTYEIAERLLDDDHDLIHKAVGWMLREMGKRDPALLRSFLTEHSKVMPRTMLRYSIEKFSERERKMWLLQSK
jgi:3-methyladenine DNA glycosylase AlkD